MSIVSGTVGAVGQMQSAEHAQDLQWQSLAQTQRNAAPYMALGTQSAGMLQDYLQQGGQLNRNFTMADFQQDPGYQFRMNQGTNALQAGGAAQGNYFSGTMGTALQDYGQNAASQEYQNAYNRWDTQNNNLFQRLFNTEQVGANQGMGVSGMGQEAATNAGLFGMQAAQSGSQAMQSGSQAALQGYNAYNQYQLAQAASTTAVDTATTNALSSTSAADLAYF